MTANLTAADLLTPRTIQRATKSADSGGVSSVQQLADAYVTRWAHDTGTRSVQFGMTSKNGEPIITRSWYLGASAAITVGLTHRRYDDNGHAVETEALGFLRVEEARKLHAQLTAALAEADAS